jgi:hypothetical protein
MSKLQSYLAGLTSLSALCFFSNRLKKNGVNFKNKLI